MGSARHARGGVPGVRVAPAEAQRFWAFEYSQLSFPGGFLVQRSIWGRAPEMGLKNQLPGITMTPYSVQKLV